VVDAFANFHREEVRWVLFGLGLVGGTAGLGLDGRRLARARRESLRRMVREKLQQASPLRR